MNVSIQWNIFSMWFKQLFFFNQLSTIKLFIIVTFVNENTTKFDIQWYMNWHITCIPNQKYKNVTYFRDRFRYTFRHTFTTDKKKQGFQWTFFVTLWSALFGTRKISNKTNGNLKNTSQILTFCYPKNIQWNQWTFETELSFFFTKNIQ